MPDGEVVTMNKSAMKLFYRRIGRSTLDLKAWMDIAKDARLPFRDADAVLLDLCSEAVCESSSFGRSTPTVVIDMARLIRSATAMCGSMSDV